MMKPISMQEFLLRQPEYPRETVTDKEYLEMACKLYAIIEKTNIGKHLHPGVTKRLALTLIGYLQDVASDAGLWRSMVDACKKLYGFSVPFHAESESYVDYELNREDIRFLVWYAISMLDESRRLTYPHSTEIIECADKCFAYLEEVYEDAPTPEGYNIARGLELHDADDAQEIFHLGNWLFLHSYLLTPAYSLTLNEIMLSVNRESKDFTREISKRLEESMMEDPTGPLALFIPEWVSLMIEGEMPKTKKIAEDAPVHPYYKKFVEATSGSDLAFFSSYEEMNAFFISALGWEPATEHLPQAKGASDYVLMVDEHKGMLMAQNVAKCIAAPGNDMYDRDYAREHSIELLCERGRCPADLLRRCISERWLPDATFPGSNDTELVKENADFIARCYLQLYYRD